jgi:O-antigen/teichoic acid export membrane protein
MSAATNISQPDFVLAPVLAPEASEFRSRIFSISRQSFVYFVGTILTATAGYFFKIYLARALGPEALGLYVLGITVIAFIGVFNSAGLPSAAAKFVSAYSAQGEYSKLSGFLRDGLTLLLVLNVVLGTALLIVGPWLVIHLYHAPRLSRYLWAFSAIMTLGVLNLFLGQVMAAYRDVARRTVITQFIGTPANIVIAIALISLGFGLTGYLVAQVASAALVFMLLGALVWRMTPKSVAPVRASFCLERQVLSFSAVACGIAGLQFALAQTDMIVLGHYASVRQVGVYAVAMTLVGFVSIALDSVNQIFSPIIAELHASENHALLQQLYSTLTKWIVVLTFPLALTLMLFSHGLMSIFGAGFQPGAVVLVLGTCGQIFNCAVGSVGYLLIMSGNQTEFIRIQVVNAALLIGLNFVLVPRLGITGAAIAMTTTTITTNLWALASVRRLLKLFPYHTGYLRLIMPVLVTTISIFAVSQIFSGVQAQWKIAGMGLVLGYAIFFGLVFLVGFENQDRQLAKLAWARAGQNLRKLAVA